MPANVTRRISLRFQGPGKFRFIVQPAIAIALGVRDGLRDAKAGEPPYFWHLLSDRARRKDLWKSGAATLSKPFGFAVLIDSLFQLLVLSRWSPLGAVIVGILLMGLPYAIARSLTNRLSRRKVRHRADETRRAA